MHGTYLLAIVVIACLILWPEEAQAVLVSTSLKIQLYWINWRAKRLARASYDLLVAAIATPLYNDYDFEHGGRGWWEKLNRGWFEMYVYAPPMITPPPFTFVNLWERDQ